MNSKPTLTLTLLLAVLFAFGCPDKKPSPPTTGGIDPCNVGKPAFSGLCVTDSDSDIHRTLDAAIGVPKDRSDFKFSFVTAEGARVRSTVEIPEDYKAAIDPAIDNEVARYKTKFPNWLFYQKPQDVDILAITCNETAISPEVAGAPIMSFSGIFAAATTIGHTGNPAVGKMYIVICQQEFAFVDSPEPRHRVDAGWKYPTLWANSIRAEIEHEMDRTNNQARFDYYQGANDQHPEPLDVP